MIDVIEIGENKIGGFFFSEIVFCPFIDPTLQMREYFIKDFGKEKSEFHMNPYWATHVLALLLRIHVIVYQHNVYEDPPVWSVISFEYNSPTHSTDN
jgi:hypothetical protein